MKKFNKIISIVLSMLIFISLFSVTVSAENSITWKINTKTGELIISGKGDMPDYEANDSWPFYKYSDSITSIYIEDGITSIGNNTFIGFTNVTDIRIPYGVTKIGEWAFAHCYDIS